MHRLFVAIRPPAAVRDALIDLMDGVKGARWVDEEQIHLTLRFIGEVDRHLAGDIHAALGAVHHPRFTLALSGLGSFDRSGGASVLWAGVAPHAPLKALHKKVDQALERVGVAPDRRAFHPHITLARLPRGAGPLRPLVESAGGLTGDPFEVDEIRLYESALTHAGPIYTVAGRYPLAPALP
ncbi:MAG: RNA 2',3'-cyclic phosphodiesterase [Allosphingosinicella sp.]